MLVVRWLLFPVLFVLALWCLLLSPESITGVALPLWPANNQTSLAEVLPIHPKNMTQAFDLGTVAQMHESCQQKTSCVESVLTKASQIMGQTVSEAQLKSVRPLIVEMDQQLSIVDRVMGFFSFVNVIWLVSIFGLLITVGPFLAYLFGEMIMRLSIAMFNNVIKPVCRFCHEWGIFEAAAYYLALCLCAQSLRYPPGQEAAAAMVALTGGFAAGPCLGYTHALHLANARPTPNGTTFVMIVSGAIMGGALVPLAVLHSSALIGFFAVASIYGALGFQFGAFGLGFFVGFKGEDAMLNCVQASVVLVGLFAVLRIRGTDPEYLHPFATGVMVLGNVMYFLGMLIMSSKWHYGHGKGYGPGNAAMLASLVGAMAVGNVWAMPAMSNTATTFFVLWVLEKECESNFGGAGIVVLFLNFVALYFIAHWLSTHPGFVYAMFDPQGMYV